MKNKKREWECKCGTMHSINKLQCSECKEECSCRPLWEVKSISNQNKSKDHIVHHLIVSLVDIAESGAEYYAAQKTLVQLGFAEKTPKGYVVFWDKINDLKEEAGMQNALKEMELRCDTERAQETIRGHLNFYKERLKTNDPIAISKAHKLIKNGLRLIDEAFKERCGLKLRIPYDLNNFIKHHKLI